jgi:hypothetical protein
MVLIKLANMGIPIIPPEPEFLHRNPVAPEGVYLPVPKPWLKRDDEKNEKKPESKDGRSDRNKDRDRDRDRDAEKDRDVEKNKGVEKDREAEKDRGKDGKTN